MSSSSTDVIPVIDLFAGPGGLGEGFSAFHTPGQNSFEILLSIERDPIARETLKLRSFFRKCSMAEREIYYQVLAEGQPVSTLYEELPDVAAEADAEAWCIELGEENSQIIHDRISARLQNHNNWVLIGGPPCQAYSLIGRSRNRGNADYRPEDDNRHVLYREYLDVIAQHHPAVFVMENVKGLLSSRLKESPIFEQILRDLKNPSESTRSDNHRALECPAYRLYTISSHGGIAATHSDYVVKMEDHGIPQARHRVIILGLREDIQYVPQSLNRTTLPLEQVLRDLPRLRSGISKAQDGESEWIDLLKSSRHATWYQSIRENTPDVFEHLERTIQEISAPNAARGAEFLQVSDATMHPSAADWFLDPNIGGVYNHSTRSHIKEDLFRYLFAACFAAATGRSPVLSEFPDELLPKHKNASTNIFQDRFRVQISDRPSTTITSHISKDGHYYIHYDPSQCRSLTVREAARLQTFPDNYFFCGPRTEQYKQVGNAVPPLLARQIAGVVSRILS